MEMLCERTFFSLSAHTHIYTHTSTYTHNAELFIAKESSLSKQRQTQSQSPDAVTIPTSCVNLNTEKTPANWRRYIRSHNGVEQG